MLQKKIKNSVVAGATNEMINIAYDSNTKLLNAFKKGSKVEGSFLNKLFLDCGLTPGKLDWSFFDGYNYSLVEFPCLSSSARSSLSLTVNTCDSALYFVHSEYDEYMNGCERMAKACTRPSASAGVAVGDSILMHLKDSAVCAGSKMVVVLSDGSYYDYIPSIDEYNVPEGSRLVRVGINPLSANSLAFVDLMRVIGNKNIEKNNAALRLARKNKKIEDKARKEYNKRLSGFGVNDIPDSIKDAVWRSSLEWARKKIG